MLSTNPLPIAILGATGMVGQKLIALIQKDPSLKIVELSASKGYVKRKYGDVVDWREKRALSEAVASLSLKDVKEIEAPFALSALPREVACENEPILLKRGVTIFSNASAFRLKKDVPLLIPEINPHHLTLLEEQKGKGKLICNPNCIVAMLVPLLFPLLHLGEIEHIDLFTLQSMSGAGYRGLSALEIAGNTIPFIEEEREKIISESNKILEKSFHMTVSVNRVPVRVGHSLQLHVHFRHPVQPCDAFELYRKASFLPFSFHPNVEQLQPLRLLSSYDERIHLAPIEEGGSKKTLRIVALAHNLMRGAALGTLMNLKSFLVMQQPLSLEESVP